MSYSIFHINLKEAFIDSNFESTKEGLYFIIWFDNIPLGNFYIEKDTVRSKETINKSIVAAINDTILFYSRTLNEDWQKFILNDEFELFSIWFTQILNDKTEESISKFLPISVIICTRNRPTYLNKCLHALQNLKFTPEEIIVVDNAPDNVDTRDVVFAYENVRYIIEPRLGLDIARNTGLRNATKTIVAFIDDDAEAHPYWIYRIWQTFENDSIEGMTGLVFPSKLDTDAQVLFEKYFSFNRGFKSKIYDINYINSNKKTGAPVWEIGAGVNMAFRKDVFCQIGYFDELLDAGAAGCNGDSEIWFRILVSGKRICYNPKAVVYHEHREDMKSLEKQIFNYMKGNTVAALIQHKYHPASDYKKYILSNLIRKTKSFVFGIYKRRLFLVRVLKLELKGIVAGIFYYYKTK